MAYRQRRFRFDSGVLRREMSVLHRRGYGLIDVLFLPTASGVLKRALRFEDAASRVRFAG